MLTLTSQADEVEKKKRTFRKFTYRGVDLDQLLDLSTEEVLCRGVIMACIGAYY